MDLVAQPLHEAIKCIESNNAKYIVNITRPVQKFFKVDNNSLYVIRQHVDADGIYHIVAAAKMGKEVF